MNNSEIQRGPQSSGLFGGPGFLKQLGLGNFGLGKLDTGDILLILVLFLLFKESGDEEFLIILLLVLFL